MRALLYALCFLSLAGMAFWAYRENYATQDALKRISALQDEIGTLRDSLAVQRAEWAYLNRPERLRDLAARNFDRLGLMPLDASQFARAGDVAYPPSTAPDQVVGDLPAPGPGEDGAVPAPQTGPDTAPQTPSTQSPSTQSPSQNSPTPAEVVP